jgi:hypothetical protein
VKSCGTPRKKSALTPKFSVASRRVTPTHERLAETETTGVRIFCLSEAQGDVPCKMTLLLHRAIKITEHRRTGLAHKVARLSSTRGGTLMQTSAELRASSRFYKRAATKESEPHLRRCLVAHAFALAQVAKRIKRREALGARKAESVKGDPQAS